MVYPLPSFEGFGFLTRCFLTSNVAALLETLSMPEAAALDHLTNNLDKSEDLRTRPEVVRLV